HGPARTGVTRLRAALVHRVILTRHDDLAGTVVVRGPDPEDPAAERLHLLVLETEDRGHRARVRKRRLRHGEAARAHEDERLLERAAQALLERALSGEAESDLAHGLHLLSVRRSSRQSTPSGSSPT